MFCNYQPYSDGGIVISSVCLSVHTLTPKPLEISTQNFQGIILWLKGHTGLKNGYIGCEGDDLMSLMLLHDCVEICFCYVTRNSGCVVSQLFVAFMDLRISK